MGMLGVDNMEHGNDNVEHGSDYTVVETGILILIFFGFMVGILGSGGVILYLHLTGVV